MVGLELFLEQINRSNRKAAKLQAANSKLVIRWTAFDFRSGSLRSLYKTEPVESRCSRSQPFGFDKKVDLTVPVDPEENRI